MHLEIKHFRLSSSATSGLPAWFLSDKTWVRCETRHSGVSEEIAEAVLTENDMMFHDKYHVSIRSQSELDSVFIGVLCLTTLLFICPAPPASERHRTPTSRRHGMSKSYFHLSYSAHTSISPLALLALSRILLPLRILDILITLLILILVITKIILVLIILILKVGVVKIIAKESLVLQRLAGEPVNGTRDQLLLDVLAEGVVEL